MRFPSSAQTSKPWRIHELTRDFRLEDVWEIPTDGGDVDVARLAALLAAQDPTEAPSLLIRGLFKVRFTLGALLGWDREDQGVGGRVTTLRERLPADLRDGTAGPEFASLPFRSLYLTDDEWAAETANSTMHGVLHVGRTPDGHGGHRAQLAIYVKPNGLPGKAYMAGIKPFRYLIYPPMLRRLGTLLAS